MTAQMPEITPPQNDQPRDHGPFAHGLDADAPQIAAAGQRIRAVLFDRNLNGHPLTLPEMEALDSLSDDQLLWIDVQGNPAELPEAMLRYGIDARYMQPGGHGGLIANGREWRYLHARALVSSRNRRVTDEALVVAIGANVVATAHHHAIAFLNGVLDTEAEQLRVGSLHAGSFAASLLDRMLTDFLDARDEFESAVDRIELLVLRRPQARHLAELQQLRRHASKLRRSLALQRDMFEAVARPDFDPGQLHDVARHWQLLSARYSKTMTSVETARDLVNGSFDVYTSRVAHGTNETMRLLTVVTVILGTLAVVAGVLGMNFKAEIFASSNGFWWTVGGMTAFSVIAIVAAVTLLTRKR